MFNLDKRQIYLPLLSRTVCTLAILLTKLAKKLAQAWCQKRTYNFHNHHLPDKQNKKKNSKTKLKLKMNGITSSQLLMLPTLVPKWLDPQCQHGALISKKLTPEPFIQTTLKETGLVLQQQQRKIPESFTHDYEL